MSSALEARVVARALDRLAAVGARLEPHGANFAVYPRGDRRRRPLARLARAQVAALLAEGALALSGAGYVLTAAGNARRARGAAPEGEADRAQHAPLVDRAVAEPEGVRLVRGAPAVPSLDRLRRLIAADGRPFYTAGELAVARRLRQDWDIGQRGLVRGSDWSAPPRGAVRGAGAAAAPDAAIDARRRVETLLTPLSAPAQRLIRDVVLEDVTLEAVERARGWPARSAKVALKLALSQLATPG